MSVYVLHIKLRAASMFLLCKVWESCFSSQASLCLWFLNNHAVLKLRLLKAVISLFLCPPVISVKGGLCGFLFNQFGD